MYGHGVRKQIDHEPQEKPDKQEYRSIDFDGIPVKKEHIYQGVNKSEKIKSVKNQHLGQNQQDKSDNVKRNGITQHLMFFFEGWESLPDPYFL